MSAPDLELVRRLMKGDERAFTEFFDGCFQGLFRFALPRVGWDEDAAEDVAQATLCAVMPKLGTYRGEAALFSWLCSFCRHEISAYYARLGRRPATVELAEDDPELIGALDSLRAAANDGPEEALRRREVARRVHTTLDRLPGHYADAL